MSQQLLIDGSSSEQTQFALIGENGLDDFEYESKLKRNQKGNIYLGKVSRIEASLQAAFVEIGNEKNAFLAFAEIHPNYFQIPIADRDALIAAEAEMEEKHNADNDNKESKSYENEMHNDNHEANGNVTAVDEEEADGNVVNNNEEEINGNIKEYREQNNAIDKNKPKNRHKSSLKRKLYRSYKIQEVIKTGQLVLVQVVKEERGNKGAALTSYISLAGKYSVLMPNSTKTKGISRKISTSEDRNKIRKIIDELNIPSEMGLIVRTAGSNKTKNDIENDLQNSISSWEEIKVKAMDSIAPSLIFEESDIIKRSIRDMVDDDVQNIFVEGNDGYQKAKIYIKQLMPKQIKKVKKYRDKVPLFFKNNIEAKLYEIYKTEVKLKSGGYLVINPTEALVSIDVNSGRSIKQKNVESTAFDTNLEAAEEIARQIKIRDLSGLIIIDFIDMHSFSNRRQVERKLKEKCRKDRARIQIGRITHFGLLEMSRQRLRESNVKWIMSLTNESQAFKILKLAEIKCLENKSKEILVHLNKKIIDFLSKNSEKDIIFFQDKNKVKVTFKEDLNFGVNDYKLEFKSRTNKIIDTIQSEKNIASETNIIKFEDKKLNYKKTFRKNTKKKYFKKYKKKSK